MSQLFNEALAGAKNPFEKLDRIFAFWERMGQENKGAGCFFGNCSAEFGQSNEKVKAIMEKNLQALRNTFKDIFQEAIDQGDLPAERDAAIMAGTLFTYAQGLALVSKGTANPDFLKGTMEIMKQSLKQ